MSSYFTSETKEDIWFTLQIFGGLALFLGLLLGVYLIISSIPTSDEKISDEIETMSCKDLRIFLLTHNAWNTGFSKAERLFKYTPCE